MLSSIRVAALALVVLLSAASNLSAADRKVKQVKPAQTEIQRFDTLELQRFDTLKVVDIEPFGKVSVRVPKQPLFPREEKKIITGRQLASGQCVVSAEKCICISGAESCGLNNGCVLLC